VFWRFHRCQGCLGACWSAEVHWLSIQWHLKLCNSSASVQWRSISPATALDRPAVPCQYWSWLLQSLYFVILTTYDGCFLTQLWSSYYCQTGLGACWDADVHWLSFQWWSLRPKYSCSALAHWDTQALVIEENIIRVWSSSRRCAWWNKCRCLHMIASQAGKDEDSQVLHCSGQREDNNDDALYPYN